MSINKIIKDNYDGTEKTVKICIQEAFKEVIPFILSEVSRKAKIDVFPYDMEPWEIVPKVIKHVDLKKHDGFEIQINRESITSLSDSLIEKYTK